MGSLMRWLDAQLYPAFQNRWDDTLFRQRILSYLGEGGDLDVLNLGAGAGIVEQMDFRGHARRICGIDPDPRVVENPYLYQARLGSANPSPTRMPALSWSSPTTSSSICLTRSGCLRRSRGCCGRAGCSSARRRTSGIKCR